MLSSIMHCLKAFSSRSKARGQRRSGCAPRTALVRMEALEERVCLAAHIWTGAASTLSSNPANWSTAGSPAGDPTASLSFPAGAANLVNQNDIAGLNVVQITIDGSGYVVSGNAITLVSAGQILGSPDGTTNALNPNIAVSSSGSRIVTNGRLTLGGIISGTAPITKSGLGTLFLSGTNTFTSSMLVSQGTLNIGNSKALGAPNSTVVLDGATLEIQGGVTVAGESLDLGTLDNNGAGTTAMLRNVSGVNTWTGTINLNSNAAMDMQSNTKLLVSGVVKGIDGQEFQAGDLLTKTGTGILEFSGLNTYDAFTDVEAGILIISSNTALGSTVAGTRVKRDASLVLTETQIGGGETVNVNVGNEPLELNGLGPAIDGALRSPVGNNSWAGVVNLATDSLIGVLNNAGLDLRGRVTGAGGLTMLGSGALTYSGALANDYTGMTFVSAGTLLVNKSLSASLTTVGRQGVLGGNGTITKPITLQTGGILSPGNALQATAMLRNQGNVGMAEGSNFDVTINGAIAGTNFDQLLVTGRASLGGANLRVSGNGGAVNGTFVILQANAGVIGTFNGLTENAEFSLTNGVRMRINYTATQVKLTHVDTAPAFENRHVSTPINEGQFATVTGRITEPDTKDTFFLEVTWGDGSRTQKYVFAPGTPRDIAVSHLYKDERPSGIAQDVHTISMFWHDQHGLGNRATLDVTVRNVAPVVVAGSDGTVGRNRLFTRSGFFVDPGHDTWTATVDYGDGNGPQKLSLQHGNRFRLNHRYRTAGIHHVVVTLHDDDGGIGSVTFDLKVV